MTVARLLEEPLTIAGKLRVANRIVKAATAEGLAALGNHPGEPLIELYRRWASGGAGLIITGNAHVDRRFRERSTSLVLDEDSDRLAFRRLSSAAHGENTPILVQLNHPGRQCPAMLAPVPLAPSASRPLFRFSGYGPARAMRETEIEDVILAFTRSARIAADCGFDGIQVHAAHGYLLSAFLSPLQNRREDRYGGSLANRARLLVEIVASIRRAVPAGFLVAVKLNVTDFERGGFDVDEAVEVACMVERAGADCLETSGGTYRRLVTEAPPSDQEEDRRGEETRDPFLEFTSRLSARLDIPVVMTGGMRSQRSIERALSSAGVAMIGLARPFCVDPDIANSMLRDRFDSLDRLPGPAFAGPAMLGPQSPFRRVRRYNAFAELAWYSEQLEPIARGDPPRTDLSPRAALALMAARDHQFLRATVP